MRRTYAQVHSNLIARLKSLTRNASNSFPYVESSKTVDLYLRLRDRASMFLDYSTILLDNIFSIRALFYTFNKLADRERPLLKENIFLIAGVRSKLQTILLFIAHVTSTAKYVQALKAQLSLKLYSKLF